MLYKDGVEVTFEPTSFVSWLRNSVAVRAVAVDSAGALARLAEAQPHGLVALGLLTGAQIGSQLLETAVRLAQPPAAIAVGGARLASALGAPFPSVVVVRRDGRPWAVLDDPRSRASVEAFLRAHALPLLVPLTAAEPAFRRLVRAHPVRLEVLLFHRAHELPPTIVTEESKDALAAARQSAVRFGGRAVFAAFDFFANDPDEITMYSLKPETLPAAVVVSNRGAVDEKRWSSKAPLPADSVRDARAALDALVETALRERAPSPPPPAGWSELTPPPGFEPPPERVAVDASGRATAAGGAGAVPLEVGLDAAAPSGEDVVSMDDDDDDDASEWRRFDDEDEDE